MLVVLQPSAGEKFDDQVDIANMILENYPFVVGEVELNFNGEKKYMRRPHDRSQIKTFIWKDYDGKEQ